MSFFVEREASIVFEMLMHSTGITYIIVRGFLSKAHRIFHERARVPSKRTRSYRMFIFFGQRVC